MEAFPATTVQYRLSAIQVRQQNAIGETSTKGEVWWGLPALTISAPIRAPMTAA